mmetsp:Transcript_13014/g.23190  ORF Transcript_13014/g.23190 Transcript_13014/m.23190 type:complete len:223 (-) Transcript_13014:1874-2542(-)
MSRRRVWSTLLTCQRNGPPVITVESLRCALVDVVENNVTPVRLGYQVAEELMRVFPIAELTGFLAEVWLLELAPFMWIKSLRPGTNDVPVSLHHQRAEVPEHLCHSRIEVAKCYMACTGSCHFLPQRTEIARVTNTLPNRHTKVLEGEMPVAERIHGILPGDGHVAPLPQESCLERSQSVTTAVCAGVLDGCALEQGARSHTLRLAPSDGEGALLALVEAHL